MYILLNPSVAFEKSKWSYG